MHEQQLEICKREFEAQKKHLDEYPKRQEEMTEMKSKVAYLEQRANRHTADLNQEEAKREYEDKAMRLILVGDGTDKNPGLAGEVRKLREQREKEDNKGMAIFQTVLHTLSTIGVAIILAKLAIR